VSLIDEDALRAVVREAVRAVVREEVLPRLAPAAPAAISSAKLTVEQVAAECVVKPPAVLEWIHAGRLKATKPSRKWIVRREDLDRFLEQQGRQPTSPDVDAQVVRILDSIKTKGR
jgi:excisionase family DNA binding protein